MLTRTLDTLTAACVYLAVRLAQIIMEERQ